MTKPGPKKCMPPPPVYWLTDADRAKAVEARQRVAGLSPEQRALAKLKSNASRLTQEFIEAALAEGRFAGEWGKAEIARAKLLDKAMDWYIGRPVPGRSAMEEPPAEEETGLEVV